VGHREDLLVPFPVGHACGVDGVGQFGVGVDQQHGQQLVAARDVAVHRRGHHAEVAGDRAHGEPGGAVGRELAACQLDDPSLDAIPRILPLAHRRSVAHVRALLLQSSARRGTLEIESTAL
jgi:hypothetical protein